MIFKRKLDRLWWRVSLFLHNFLSVKYTASVCGHKTKLMEEVDIFGEKNRVTLVPLKKKGKLEYCIKCLSEMTIRCAWCGKPIIIGDPITLYAPEKKDFQIPNGVVVYKKNPLQLVGCLRRECSEGGIDRAGFWVAPGVVYRVLSPLEMIFASGSEDPIICNDLRNIKTAIPYPFQNQ